MIIVDTGFWVALFNYKDQYHQSAQQALAKYSSEPLMTTWPVLTESCHLLLQRSSSTYTAGRFHSPTRFKKLGCWGVGVLGYWGVWEFFLITKINY